MLVLCLGLALRTANNGLGLIGQGLGLVSLGLSHRGLTLHVRASRSCSITGMKELSILSTLQYSIFWYE